MRNLPGVSASSAQNSLSINQMCCQCVKTNKIFQTTQLVLNYAYVQITNGRNTIFMLRNVMTIIGLVLYCICRFLDPLYSAVLHSLLSTRRSHTNYMYRERDLFMEGILKDAHNIQFSLVHQMIACHNDDADSCLPQSACGKHLSTLSSKDHFLK